MVVNRVSVRVAMSLSRAFSSSSVMVLCGITRLR